MRFCFPHLEIAAVEGAIPDPEVSAERLGILQQLSDPESHLVIVINQHSMDEKVPASSGLHKATLKLHSGERLDREIVLRELQQAGYENVVQVTERGQFSVRGGVMDIFSWQQTLPVRLEWFDNELESIREFEIDQQTSVRSLDRCAVTLRVPIGRNVNLRSYLKDEDLTITVGSSVAATSVVIITGTNDDSDAVEERYSDAFFALSLDMHREVLRSSELTEVFQERIHRQLQSWVDEQYLVAITYGKSSEQISVEKITEIF